MKIRAFLLLPRPASLESGHSPANIISIYTGAFCALLVALTAQAGDPKVDPDDAFFCTNEDEATMRCSPASCDYWWPKCKDRPVKKPEDFPKKCLGENMPCEVYSTATMSHEDLMRSSGNHKVEFDDDITDKKKSKGKDSSKKKSSSSGSKSKPAASGGGGGGGGSGGGGSGGSGGGGGSGAGSGSGGAGAAAGNGDDGISGHSGPAPSLAEGSSFDQGSAFNGGSFKESGRRASGASSSPTLQAINGSAEPSSGAGSGGSGASGGGSGSAGEKANSAGATGDSFVDGKSGKPMGLAALNYDPSTRGIVEQSGDSGESAKGAEIVGDQANSEKSERYTDPWMDYVSVESRKTLIDKLAKSKELREKLRAKIKEVAKRDKPLSGQEKERLDYYEGALAEAEDKIKHGSLEALAPLEAREAFSMDGDETEREIRRLLSTLDSEAASLATKDEGIHYSLFPRVHRALWRQISNGKIPLRIGEGKN